MATSQRRSLRMQAIGIALALTVFFGTIGVAKAVGWWSTSGRIDAAGTAVSPTADPDSIKGWMTVQQVCDAFAIEPATLYEHFAMPLTTPVTTELKDLESVAPDFEISQLREWLASLKR